jgi:hypothetical protein
MKLWSLSILFLFIFDHGFFFVTAQGLSKTNTNDLENENPTKLINESLLRRTKQGTTKGGLDEKKVCM